MQSNNKKRFLAALLVTYLVSTPTLAGISPEDAARLGADLTTMGAEKAGNADGSIPAWSGKWLGAPPHLNYGGSGSQYPDPYADEKPLFVITAQNMAQYADQLSEGQKALFQRYPNSFRMPVYPSHRDFRYSPDVERKIAANAINAKLVHEGNGVTGAIGASPFPIPKNGHELMWNLNLPARAWKEDAVYKMALVLANGNRVYESLDYKILSVWDSPAETVESLDGRQAYALLTTLEPTRKKGEIILAHSFTDPISSPSQSWQYLPGNRRVRRAPTVAYDTPYGAGGFRVMDEDRLFNGAPDRYDWKLVGKQEIYVPYNNYKLDDPSLKLDDLLATSGHVNPEYMRYERHRAWVLEANLKPGKRHIYRKRVIYIDEDSWIGLLADNYDGKGNLWRSNMQTTVYAYDLNGFQARVAIFHDLIAGSYLADRLLDGQRPAKLNSSDIEADYFTTANLRKLGK
ncbi:DUF1329 domain-containing protein [Pseudomonas sp. BN417]|uniref:DUF1329 domain-containing protein n=1 Tax=Pseudomonas sp. BN417 TaxID=2567890 RepID=UPI002456C0FF|nr:DUF1329 domain-containing protein [Pseudomonas sp. BN417]MDH4555909.1 DUF1329 domain-containing protein [Pseudomonas sp. BN417]